MRYVLPLATLLLYLPFLTHTYYWDGVLFSLDIEGVRRGELPFSTLFHPNHLLYSPLGYVLYSGIPLRAITVLQVFNVLASGAAGYVLHGLAKHFTRSASIGIFCWLLFTFGATWWKFSTDADSYIVAVLLILLAIRFATGEPRRLVAAAVCHALAMLFHELAIFVYVPIFAAILIDSRRPVRKRIPSSLLYAAGTCAAVTAAYLVCYSYADKTISPTLLRWITSYSPVSNFPHSAPQLLSLSLLSYLKLFAGGKLSLLHDYFSLPVALALLIAVAACLWAVKLYRTKTLAERRSTLVLWVWFVTYGLFFLVWDPGSAFYKLFVWPPIVLLMGCYVRNRAALALAVALGAWNFAAFIYPHAHDSAFPVVELARRVDRELPKGATVYYNQFLPDDWYLDYFAPGHKWDQLPVKPRPGLVCMETTALEVSHVETDPLRRWDLVNAQHHIKLECLK